MAIEPFSVLISIYCKENPKWLQESLDCIFSQTIRPNEIVLVKDGPLTPELESVIDTFIKRRDCFKIIQNEKNLGLGLSLRKGITYCSNEIIARMDTDDLMPTDRFEKQLNAIRQGYDVVSCWSQIFVDDINNIIAVKRRPENHNDIVKLAHKRSPVCHAGAMYRKSAVLGAGNYENCPLNEDYHLWVRMIMAGSVFYNIQEVLYYVRTNSEQISRRGGFKFLRTELRAFSEFRKMGFYTQKDYLVNSIIRIVTRLMPMRLRKYVIKLIWNHES